MRYVWYDPQSGSPACTPARALNVRGRCVQDPSNAVYQKALEMTQKAPELHAELQRQLAAQGEVRYCRRHCPAHLILLSCCGLLHSQVWPFRAGRLIT